MPVVTPPTRTGPNLRAATSRASGDARERILRTAHDLFNRYGVQAVGVDRIIAEAGVAKMTLYRHFRSKGELVLAVLERHEQFWTRDWLEQEIERRGGTPEERLLAIFDAFDDWFRRRDYEGCLFVNSLLETRNRDGSVGEATLMRLANVRSMIRRLAEEAGIDDPDGFARQWQIIMLGSTVLAVAGDTEAARRGREIATHLIAGARAGAEGLSTGSASV
jgi:AcrR family transcriptional regulator